MPVRLQITSPSLRALLLGAATCLSVSLANAQAPIIDAGQPLNPAADKSAASGQSAGGGSAMGNMVIQLQSLQQEVMQLRGIVEDQGHEIETLKQQSLDRYNDLDQRLGRLQGGAAPAPAAAATPVDASAAPAPNPTAAPVPAAAAAPAPMATPKADEYGAYQAAFTKLKGQDFSGAIKAFTAFLAAYPSGTLAPNGHYWLGKAYLLAQPQDLDKAQQEFTKVGDYPQSNKVPDALYELGKVYFLKGDKAKAKATLQQVIDNYGTSGSAAPQLAKQFLDQNFPAGN